MNYPLHIIKESPTLALAVKYIFEHNTSNYLPYHNLNHLLQTMKHCHILIMKDSQNLDHDTKITILLSALFHDFNYNLDVKGDKNKIDLAKNGFLEFYDKYKKDFQEDIKITEVFNILDATEYPYAFDILTYPQMVIRDADMMQLFETNFIHQNIFGLAQEFGISIEDMVKKQRGFVESLKFNTLFAQEYKRIHWDYVMREIEILEDLY